MERVKTLFMNIFIRLEGNFRPNEEPNLRRKPQLRDASPKRQAEVTLQDRRGRATFPKRFLPIAATLWKRKSLTRR
jgi:hypothetical protein